MQNDFPFPGRRNGEITAAYPAGKIDTTIENLKAAAAGEHEEYTVLYPEFARIARGGFPSGCCTIQSGFQG